MPHALKQQLAPCIAFKEQPSKAAEGSSWWCIRGTAGMGQAYHCVPLVALLNPSYPALTCCPHLLPSNPTLICYPPNLKPTWFPVLAAALISRISFSSSRRSAKISRSMSVGLAGGRAQFGGEAWALAAVWGVSNHVHHNTLGREDRCMAQALPWLKPWSQVPACLQLPHHDGRLKIVSASTSKTFGTLRSWSGERRYAVYHRRLGTHQGPLL